MPMRNLLFALALLAAVSLFGCDRYDRNAPSQGAIDSANANRLKAIEEDPKLSPQEKKALKTRLGLGPKGDTTSRPSTK